MTRTYFAYMYMATVPKHYCTEYVSCVHAQISHKTKQFLQSGACRPPLRPHVVEIVD